MIYLLERWQMVKIPVSHFTQLARNFIAFIRYIDFFSHLIIYVRLDGLLLDMLSDHQSM